MSAQPPQPQQNPIDEIVALAIEQWALNEEQGELCRMALSACACQDCHAEAWRDAEALGDEGVKIALLRLMAWRTSTGPMQ